MKNDIDNLNKKMLEEEHPIGPTSTDLSLERTVLSHERTLMSWVRTATSLISFGFTIYKFFQELRNAEGSPERLLSPRAVGMILIAMGFLGLLFAEIQHHKAMKNLRKYYPDIPTSISEILAILILMLGILMFLGALFRQ